MSKLAEKMGATGAYWPTKNGSVLLTELSNSHILNCRRKYSKDATVSSFLQKEIDRRLKTGEMCTEEQIDDLYIIDCANRSFKEHTIVSRDMFSDDKSYNDYMRLMSLGSGRFHQMFRDALKHISNEVFGRKEPPFNPNKAPMRCYSDGGNLPIDLTIKLDDLGIEIETDKFKPYDYENEIADYLFEEYDSHVDSFETCFFDEKEDCVSVNGIVWSCYH